METEKQDHLQRAMQRILDNAMIATGCVDGVITAVDEGLFTCDVKIGESTFFDCPLRVLKGSQASVIEIPAANSACVVMFRDHDITQPQLVWADQVDKLLINTISLVEFNGGQLGGMVKVEDLVTKLNNLENDVNQLKTAFSTWVPVPNDGGAALKAASASWAGSELTPTERDELENLLIKQ